MKVINLKLSDNVEEKLMLKAAFKGFDTMHEYMLAAIIDHEDFIALIPLLIKN